MNTKNEKILEEINQYLIQLGYVGKYEIQSQLIGVEFFFRLKNTEQDFEEIERREKMKHKLDLFSEDKTNKQPRVRQIKPSSFSKSSGTEYNGA